MSQSAKPLFGIFDPSGSPTRTVDRVSRAAGRRCELQDGPLAVAAPMAFHAGCAAALIGHLYNASRLVRELGIHDDCTPERVLVAAYRRWGEGMLRHLRGDFVVVVWDSMKRRGLIARDPLGSRPLHYVSRGTRLEMASEIRDLLRLLTSRPGPNRAAVAHWLLFSDYREGTLYEGVRRLKPGHLLSLSEAGWNEAPYREPRFQGTLNGSEAELADRTLVELRRAVDCRVAHDGETGVLLSGGLDSAAVASLAVENAGADRIHAYSGTFPHDDQLDETGLIDLLADRLRVQSTRAVVRPGGMLAASLDYLDQWDLPLVWPNWAWERLLLRRASEDGVTVMLHGEGGDEAFGTRSFLVADRLRRGRLPAALSLIRRQARMPDNPSRRLVQSQLMSIGLRPLIPHRLQAAVRARRDPFRDVPRWISRTSAAEYQASDHLWDWKRINGPRWWAYLTDLFGEGIDACGALDLIRHKAIMAGLETRHPLFDTDLVDFALSLPPELSFDPRFSRPLFRRSLQDSIQDEIRLRRRKSNFAPFIHACIHEHDLVAARRLLASPNAEVAAFVDHSRMCELLLDRAPEHYLHGRSWAFDLWRLLTAECWLRRERDPSFVERELAAGQLAAVDCDLVTVLPGAPDVVRV